MKFDVDACLEQAWQCQLLKPAELRHLCRMVTDLLFEESNCQYVSSPVVVCGDLHGQFYDVLEMFKAAGGAPPDHRFVFMGDYVDRGHHSLETVTLLMLLKLKHPDCVVMLRGNHESRMTSQQYGFYDEVVQKLGSADIWNAIMNVFDFLPVSALIDNRIFCVHGGLSPSLPTIDSLSTLYRGQEIPFAGPVADLLWSDPDNNVQSWAESVRGAGFLFGALPTKQFNHINGLDLVSRSHQLLMDGYQYMFDESLVTVWSAPNYCYRCGNIASVMAVDGHNREFKVFEEATNQPQPGERSAAQYFL